MADGHTRRIGSVRVRPVQAGSRTGEKRREEVGKPNGISSWLEPPAVLALDFTVDTVPIDTPPSVLKSLLTIAGGEHDAASSLTAIADGRLRPRARYAACGYSLLD